MSKNKDHQALKIKKKSIQSQLDDGPVKIDLTNPSEQGEVVKDTAKVEIKEKPKTEKDAVHGETADSVQDAGGSSEEAREDTKVAVPQPVESVKDDGDQKPILEEITEEEVEEAKEEVPEPVIEDPKINLPENIEKLVEFMEQTGGTLEDYVRLNADYSNIDSTVLLREYYKNTKPHLNDEEISFVMEENFQYDEENDDERDIKIKKLAQKEEIAKAKDFLEDLKGKYYDEIKLRPGVTQEQKKAVDFFNRYTQNQEVALQQHEDFKQKTTKLLNNEFKGFDFNVGEKKFRYGVKNPNEVAKAQSNLQDFVQKFLDDRGNVNDTTGYHKAMYAARNADNIAQHFYEQGKADAVKDVVTKSKNISNEVRKAPSGEVFVGGMKVKAISGTDVSRLKIKKR